MTALAWLAAASAWAQDPAWNGESWALFQGLSRSERIDLHVPSGPCERAAAQLARRLKDSFEVSSDPLARDRDALRILVGLPSEAQLSDIARACGVEPTEDGFRVLGRDYTRPGDALVAVFEDPAREGRPLCLVLGNDVEQLAVYLDGIPRLTRPHLWVHSDGEPALECPLALDGRPLVDGARDYLARREEYFGEGRSLDFEGVSVYVRSAPEPERWRTYGLALAGARKRVLAWFGAKEPPAVEVFLYEHAEDFEACLGASELSLVNRLRPRVHVLLAPGVPDDGGAGLARVLARSLAGPPGAPWLDEGLAVAAAERWWQRPLEEWIAHLARAKLLPDVRDLLRPGADERTSMHVLAPAYALLFQQLVLGSGSEPRRVRALWKGAALEPRKLTAFYQRGVAAALKAGKSTGERARADARADRAVASPFRHGLALVEDEGTGYSARAVETALAEARALAPGPDAVSLTVFGSGEDPRPPLYAPRARSAHGSTSDLALASASAAARALDMRVLVSLEVLSHPNGAWADVLSWTDEDDQREFWRRYERVAMHYALLCELLRVEIFSFGSNLRESTRTEVEDDARDPELVASRRKGWQILIDRLHAAYGGMLTYGARYPSEALAAGFFDRLDFVGLLLYPRLARGEDPPAEAELRRNLRFELEQALEFAVRWNKPLLVMQLGFPSRSRSWQRPLVPRGAVDLAAQQRTIEALADVLEGPLVNGPWLRGVYLWNWPIDARRAGPEDGGFSLRGKPAADALRRVFAR